MDTLHQLGGDVGVALFDGDADLLQRSAKNGIMRPTTFAVGPISSRQLAPTAGR